MNTLIMTNMFKQTSSFAQTAEDKNKQARLLSLASIRRYFCPFFLYLRRRLKMLPAFFVPENGGGDQGRGTFRSMVPSERIPAFPAAENRRKWRIILFCQGFTNETRFLRFFITKTV